MSVCNAVSKCCCSRLLWCASTPLVHASDPAGNAQYVQGLERSCIQRLDKQKGSGEAGMTYVAPWKTCGLCLLPWGLVQLQILGSALLWKCSTCLQVVLTSHWHLGICQVWKKPHDSLKAESRSYPQMYFNRDFCLMHLPLDVLLLRVTWSKAVGVPDWRKSWCSLG